MIFPIWQQEFSSSHLLAKKVSEILEEPTTHTGTLDPLASGVLILLTGEDRQAKGHLNDWHKTYEFTIWWGTATDSLDILGLPKETNSSSKFLLANMEEKIHAAINNFPSVYRQQIPAFAAKRLVGQSSFDLAKAGRIIKPSFRQINIFSLSTNSVAAIETKSLEEEIYTRIKSVVGDFRQKEILYAWQNYFNNQLLPATSFFSHHTAKVSTGCYIRQLTQDISNIVNMAATTWQIERSQNGPYTKIDCLSLDEIGELK